MATLYREADEKSRSFVSLWMPDLSVGTPVIVDQSNRAEGPESARRSSAVTSLALATLLAAAPELTVGQTLPADASAAARAGAIAHAQKMRRLFPDVGGDTQKSPVIIPQLEINLDPTGAIATFQLNGPTETAKNVFFQDIGTNGRKCFTCHQPGDGWSLSAQHAQERFDVDPNEPLFRLVDGATCPSDDVSTYRAKKAYSLLLAKGLIRIGPPTPIPAAP